LSTSLIQPLGHKAKEYNERFAEEYAKVLNKFSRAFSSEFCDADGAVNWNKLLVYNSGIAR